MASVTELESQLELARVAEKKAQREAVERQAEQDREMRKAERNAADEIRKFKEAAEATFNAKVPPSRPGLHVRNLARRFLHAGPGDYAQIHQLGSADPRFGAVYGVLGNAGAMMERLGEVGVGDDNLYAAIDAIGCQAWRAVIARAQFLAGEALT
jgi:hypothetical protein